MEFVKKHQCLQEPGSSSGYNGWKQSLTFKMGNFQSTLRDSGCEDIMTNTKQKIIKKPRKIEVNFLLGYKLHD